METTINLSAHEQQSGLSRVSHAEFLILQLPIDHDGRNTWLLNYGVGIEAKTLRGERALKWIPETESCELVN